MSSVVRQDLLALFCADRHKQNDRGVVTVNRWKMWQILAYWQTIGAKHKNNYGRDGARPSISPAVF